MAIILAAKPAIMLITALIGGGAIVGTVVKDKQGNPLITSLFGLTEKQPEDAPQNKPSSLLSELPKADKNPPPTKGGASKIASLDIQGEPSSAQVKLDSTSQSDQADNTSLSLPADPNIPTFDLLRVERDGSTVIAGLAAPGSKVEILAGNKIVGEAQANDQGDFVVVFEEPLPAGDHELLIRSLDTKGQTHYSKEAGIVSVPEIGVKGEEVLAMISGDGVASRILQAPDQSNSTDKNLAAAGSLPKEALSVEAEKLAVKTPGAETVAKEEPKTKTANVRVRAVDVETDQMFIAGVGEPGQRVRLYLDNEYLDQATISPKGTFLIEVDRGLKAGRHALRADQIDTSTAIVSSRSSTFIDHEIQMAATMPAKNDKPAIAAPQPSEAQPKRELEVQATAAEKVKLAPNPTMLDQVNRKAVITAEETAGKPVLIENAIVTGNTLADANPQIPVIRTGRAVIIRRGDNLWRISRRMLGEGRRYTVIFNANSAQIEDPDLIFPGQVFDVPEDKEAAVLKRAEEEQKL